MKVTVSVAITLQLEVSATLAEVKISTANMCVTIFIEIIEVGVSVAIMQVVLYFLQCIIHMTFYIVIMQVAVFIVAMSVTV